MKIDALRAENDNLSTEKASIVSLKNKIMQLEKESVWLEPSRQGQEASISNFYKHSKNLANGRHTMPRPWKKQPNGRSVSMSCLK